MLAVYSTRRKEKGGGRGKGEGGREDMTHLVDQGELHSEGISDGSCALGPAGVRRDDDGVLKVRDIIADVTLQQRAAIQVIDGDIKKALILGIVKVHRDDMIRASTCQEVCHQRTSLRNPLLIACVFRRRPFGARAGRLALDT